MKPKLILISGKAGSGKDTVARHIEEELSLAGKRVLVTHYADFLKYILRTYFRWDGRKDARGRALLQYIGTDVVRARQPDFWVDFVLAMCSLSRDLWDFVIIADARFPNEITRPIERGFAVTHIRVERPDNGAALSPLAKAHASETALDGFPADYTIANAGSKYDLGRRARAFTREKLLCKTTI